MRTLLISFALLLTITLTGCSDTSWREYKSELGHYRVLMPAEPKQSKQSARTEIGDIDLFMSTASHKQIEYLTVFSTFPTGYVKSAPVETLLDRSRDGSVANTHGTLISETNITLDSHPGRELVISVANGKGKIRQRFFLVGDTLLQVIAVSPTEKFDSPEIKTYMDSFKLVS